MGYASLVDLISGAFEDGELSKYWDEIGTRKELKRRAVLKQAEWVDESDCEGCEGCESCELFVSAPADKGLGKGGSSKVKKEKK